MIRDARALRAEFVPREVDYRDAEINHLSSVLKPIKNGEPVDTGISPGQQDRENMHLEMRYRTIA